MANKLKAYVLQESHYRELITEGLVARGYSEADVKKILGENHLRVLREALGE